MEDKKIIPAAEGLPFSKAVISDSKYLMEISGQIGMDPETGKVVEGIEQQTPQAMDNVRDILEEVGWNLQNLIKVRILLTDMKDYSKVNEIYANYFEKNFPTRVAVVVKELPLGALIELDCTAVGDNIEE